jgi:hypothetical protein
MKRRRRVDPRAYGFILALLTVSGSLGLFYTTGNPPPASSGPGPDEWFPPHSSSTSVDVLEFDDRNASLDERLVIASAQGLLNRQVGHLYLSINRSDDFTSFLFERKDLIVRIRSWDWVFANRSSTFNGSVIYDPSNKDTINVATMYSARMGLVVAGPDMADKLRDNYGIQPKLDLRTGRWSGMRAPSIYLEALKEFDANRLAILRPEKWALRDYLIASDYFVFYLPQGPVALPSDVQAMEEIMRSTPSGAPILGWFDMPTHAEENFAVQVISRSGKGVLGGEDVPNLSYLSGLNASTPLMQRHSQVSLPDKGKKAYVAFSMPDGDNIDFASKTMMETWKDPKRGTLPVAWCISPSFAELAPTLAEYYYSSATNNDAFVAGPSGAHYIYPDYFPRGELPGFLQKTRSLMDAMDLRDVWLLNSFTAYETPYSDEVLRTYAMHLSPRMMFLDYGDSPASRTAWVVSAKDTGGNDRASIVVRSTHLWSTLDNFVAKVKVMIDASGGRPVYIYAPIYPWSKGMSDAMEAVERLNDLTGGGVEAVSIDQLYQLMARGIVDDASSRVEGENGLVRWLFPDAIGKAEEDARKGKGYLSSEDYDLASMHGHAASESIKDADAWVIIVLSVAFIFVVSALTVKPFFRRVRSSSARSIRGRSLRWCILLLSTLLLVEGIAFEATRFFWDYYAFVVGSVALFCMPYLENRVRSKASPSSRLGFGLGLQAFGGVLLTVHPLGIVALFAGFYFVLRVMFGGEGKMPAYALMSAFGVSGVVVVLAATGKNDWLLLVLSVLCACSVLVARIVPLRREGTKPGSAWGITKRQPSERFTTTLALAFFLLLLPLAFSRSAFFSLRFDETGTLIVGLAVVAFLLVTLLGHGILRFVRSRSALMGATLVFLVLSAISANKGTTSLFVLLSLGCTAAFVLTFDAAKISIRSFVPKFVTVLWAAWLAYQFPPISVSLYLTPLPYVLEYMIYAPPIALCALVTVLLVRVVRSEKRKARAV